MKLRMSTALATVVVAGYAAVLPFLYESLSGVIQRSHEQLFVGNARTFARLLAQQAEVGQVLESAALTGKLLDTVVLNGDGVLAELRGDAGVVRSTLGMVGLQFPAEEDQFFGQHGDTVYFTKTLFRRGDHRYELRLGFDERPTLLAVAGAKRRMLWTLGAYLGLSMVGALALGNVLSHPVRQLQRAARQVATGSLTQPLRLKTPVREISDLAEDLHRMRDELVGASERLRVQMQAREEAEQNRAQLEQRLQHRERLETVGTLAGGIAHEFNNTLVPIILLTESALKVQPAGSATRTDLQTVLAAARRAGGLVKQILTFSRELDSLRLEPADLREVVGEALRLFKPLISPNTQLIAQLPDHCPPVMVDRGLAVQLVMNLCTNAYQALRGESGVVTVAVAEVGGDAGQVELQVRDTGQGMDAATAARIFAPFFTTRDVGEGTGLGLSVVHGIVQSFGATISVESTVGQGSTFRVRFPLNTASPSWRDPASSTPRDNRSAEQKT
jgi:signal transduction histidine kinase